MKHRGFTLIELLGIGAAKSGADARNCHICSLNTENSYDMVLWKERFLS